VQPLALMYLPPNAKDVSFRPVITESEAGARSLSTSRPQPEMPEPMAPEQALEALRAFVRGLGSALVCYSGGIDSALVLAIAHEQLGERAAGMTAVSPSLAPSEREGATRFAASIGARHYLVESHEIERPGYVANAPDRCFHCKSELYEIAAEQQKQHGLSHVLNGTNRDDLGDYRPGLKAADLAGVVSPLAALGFGKATVRAVAQLLGLPIWDKPASACLSSRIPYGTAVTRERLAQIGGLEQALKELGFTQVRVRWHGNIARIEVGTSELARAFDADTRALMIRAGKQHGFKYVTLDLEGYRVGSHNEVLVGGSLRVI
jgi:pyridinium-3,5-biscarboxylic acid mononucleotide sulfurtransferase